MYMLRWAHKLHYKLKNLSTKEIPVINDEANHIAKSMIDDILLKAEGEIEAKDVILDIINNVTESKDNGVSATKKQVTCDKCGKLCINKSALIKHMQLKHKTSNVNKTVKKLLVNQKVTKMLQIVIKI